MANRSGFNWQLLDAGPLLLDGGGMFGLVPRVVWERLATPDDKHRIRLAHNCILLHHPSGPVVIEVGSGDKFDAKNRAIFGLTDRTIIQAVEETGTNLADVQNVIVTHLHFDHAGGLTRTARVDSSTLSSPVLTFSNARIHTQKREWADAIVNRSVMTRTYLAENLEPIRERLVQHDSVQPFPIGATPDRSALPESKLEERLTEVIPGVFTFIVPGHTWGQQAVMFKDDGGRTVVFTPDVMPTAWHVGAAYSMAYDVEPYTSLLSRRWFLTEAMQRNWLLVIDHEPATPLVRVREDGKGWFKLIPEQQVQEKQGEPRV